ncbi:MAG: UDP-3-O-acyl-N-acetylglucosamine deacetylase, partial [Polyangiaceae bacterium]
MRVELHARPGPIRFVQQGRGAALADLRVVRADAGVRLVGPGGAPAVDLCEHLLAALAGTGVRDGVEVRVDGPELPLLDGGAASFAAALLDIQAPRGPAALQVVRAARFAEGAACYRLEPSDDMRIEVEVEFPPPVGRERAEWSGDADDFVRRIAPARTFGWRSDHAALLARGR